MEKFSIKEILGEMKKNDSGLIMIVALGILVMMSYVSIILTQQIIETNKMVERMNNSYSVRNVADSVMEYLKWKMPQHEAGWNEEINCFYNTEESNKFDKTSETNTNEGGCDKRGHEDFEESMELITLNEKVKVNIKVKGRAEEDDKFISGCQFGSGLGGTNIDPCYSTPNKGEGNVAENCKRVSESALEDPDHPCNWNKLASGSTLTNRIAIPLYYAYDEKYGYKEEEWGIYDKIKNPYKDMPGGNQFIVRLRTPCLPCVLDKEEYENGVNRICESYNEENICDDDERFELEENESDDTITAIIQWQLSGICKDEKPEGEECSFIPYINKSGEKKQGESIIDAKLLNDNLGKNNFVLTTLNKLLDTRTYEIEDKKILDVLQIMEKPLFTMFLSGKRKNPYAEKQLIPYLEYQIISDTPISGPNTELKVKANVNGYNYEQKYYIENEKPLIDFAILN